jgi:hypothetical protein
MANVVTHHHACILLVSIALTACGGGEAELDPCKLDGQPPRVVVGEGRTAYAALADGAVMPIEPGPQGGHHVWVALRTQGLGSRGSIISITGQVAEIPASVGPFDTIFQLRPVADGWCEVSGVRFQVDQQLPVTALDGRVMSLTARVSDKTGDAAADTRNVVLARQAR